MPAKGGPPSRSLSIGASGGRVHGPRSGRRRLALAGDLLPQRREAPRGDRGARLLEQAQVEAEVVERGEPTGQALAGLEQMAEIGARVTRAGLAVAARIGRLRVVAVAGVAEPQQSVAREEHAVARVPRREHAIEEVDARRDRVDEVDRASE